MEELTVFQSTHHKRFEHGIEVSQAAVSRIVKMEFSPDFSRMVFSVDPTLTPKPAARVAENGNVLIYQGIDPDYRFELERIGDQLRRVSLFRMDRNLEIRYLN
jgi:hypothetical protein